MKMTMTTPCDTCPFRTDRRPFLRAARAKEIAQGLLLRQATFTCHKTTTLNDLDDEERQHIPYPEEQHCAGALIMLEHMRAPNQLMRIYERLGFYDRTKLCMDAPVYTTTSGFVLAHKLRRRARRKKAKTRV